MAARGARGPSAGPGSPCVSQRATGGHPPLGDDAVARDRAPGAGRPRSPPRASRRVYRMAVELSEPRSRRALLAAAAGAAVATVASALGRPSPVNAATGYFDSASASTAAVRGLNTAASGYPAFGVDGESASTDGIAVRGQALASTGETCGVFGQTQSTSGRGVIGQAFAATGYTHGVLGQSQSTSGMGVSGYATAATGDTFGVRGSSESTSGTGVCGNAAANSTGVMGISGISGSCLVAQDRRLRLRGPGHRGPRRVRADDGRPGGAAASRRAATGCGAWSPRAPGQRLGHDRYRGARHLGQPQGRHGPPGRRPGQVRQQRRHRHGRGGHQRASPSPRAST